MQPHTRTWSCLTTVLLAAALGLSRPDAASAGAVVKLADGILGYQHVSIEGDEGHDVAVEQAGPDAIRLVDREAFVGVVPGAPCQYDGPSARVVLCDVTGIRELEVSLGDGNDRFIGAASLRFVVCGGAGNDAILGGPDIDTLVGGRGDDVVAGSDGPDLLAIELEIIGPESCSAGDDAATARDVLVGGPENDVLQGGPGDDLELGGDGDDNVFGYGGHDSIDGGPGSDVVAGLDGDDTVQGSDGRDSIFGGAGDDRLDGGPGTDFIGGPARFDAFAGGPAAAASVETGDDRLSGGAGDDVLYAGPGDSVFDTSAPFDVRTAGFVDRRLESAELNGADVYTGGDGRDRVSYLNRARTVRVTLDSVADDGSPGEGDRVAADVEDVLGGAREDVLVARPEGSLLFGDLGPDELVGGSGPDSLNGGLDDSPDRLTGGGGDDLMSGGPGDDTVAGGSGRDALSGGAGDDRVDGGADVDGVEGGTGGDILDGGGGDDCVAGLALGPADEPSCPRFATESPRFGADGDDRLIGGAGNDHLTGGSGEDVADFSTARVPVTVQLGEGTADLPGERDRFAGDVESARGGFGADTLIGDGAANALDGGPGQDLVVGGPGIDRLRGGAGGDLLIARDADADAVRCGTAADVAVADKADEAVAALSDVCEVLDAGGRGAAPGLARVAPAGRCALPVRLRRGGRTFSLPLITALPWGARIDATSCAALVRGPAASRAARVGRGRFILRRAARGVALRTGGAPPCGAGVRIRRLTVSRSPAGLAVMARGVRVSGRGATWTVSERCRATEVRIRHGEVRVAERGGRVVTVSAGHRHVTPIGRRP